MTNEAQNYLAKHALSIPQILRSAIIVNNLPVRILAKFYMRFFKPAYPTRIFADLESSSEWLLNLKIANENSELKVG